MIVDYRQPENRLKYFKELYNVNVSNKVHPGLVYLYLPELKAYYNWDDEEALWFAVINGHTQNPITSLKILEFMPSPKMSESEWKFAEDKFNADWTTLSFDADRNKHKKNTIKGLRSYVELMDSKSQVELFSNKTYEEYWDIAHSIYSFGRLSTFSYLEYVRITGFGSDCTNLMFNDFSGSRSHRNGMFFLLGMDDMIFDKRQIPSHNGKYDNFENLCETLEDKAERFLFDFTKEFGYDNDISKFTLESCLCQFKNGFFKRRYPGVYADMAFDRIKWYDSRGFDKFTEPFKAIRSDKLPDWLREECEVVVTPRKIKASMLVDTGKPFRSEYVLGEKQNLIGLETFL
jgi:hypothetical protein